MGVIGGLLSIGFVLCLIILTFYCCCRVNRRRPNQRTSNMDDFPEDNAPYRQTGNPSSPSTFVDSNRQQNTYNPYFMETNRTIQDRNPAVGPGTNFYNPHQSTSLFHPTNTAYGGNVGVPTGGLPYPIHPHGMPMPTPAQNFATVNNIQPSAPLNNDDDQPPPYHAVVGQNPYQPQPYKYS